MAKKSKQSAASPMQLSTPLATLTKVLGSGFSHDGETIFVECEHEEGRASIRMSHEAAAQLITLVQQSADEALSLRGALETPVDKRELPPHTVFDAQTFRIIVSGDLVTARLIFQGHSGLPLAIQMAADALGPLSAAASKGLAEVQKARKKKTQH